jgi:hypothetical protein
MDKRSAAHTQAFAYRIERARRASKQAPFVTPIVFRGEVLELLELTGEKAASERRIRQKADASRAASFEHTSAEVLCIRAFMQ